MYKLRIEDFHDKTIVKYVRMFESQKNRVFQAELIPYKRFAVVKFFGSNDADLKYIEECRNLLKLKKEGIDVPQVLSCLPGILVLEHIPGVTIDCLSKNLDTGNWIKELAAWFAKLHSIKAGKDSLLKGDVNLKNFIFANNRIFAVDFEGMYYGNYMEDVSDLCMFLITNPPSFAKEKKSLIRNFLREYEIFSGNRIYSLKSYLLKSRKKLRERIL